MEAGARPQTTGQAFEMREGNRGRVRPTVASDRNEPSSFLTCCLRGKNFLLKYGCSLMQSVAASVNS
jgi:hypothetical protein